MKIRGIGVLLIFSRDAFCASYPFHDYDFYRDDGDDDDAHDGADVFLAVFCVYDESQQWSVYALLNE